MGGVPGVVVTTLVVADEVAEALVSFKVLPPFPVTLCLYRWRWKRRHSVHNRWSESSQNQRGIVRSWPKNANRVRTANLATALGTMTRRSRGSALT